MTRPHRQVLAARLAAGVVAAGLLAGCTDDPGPASRGGADEGTTSPTPDAAPWTVPGLVDASGQPIEVPEPPPATGAVIDVTELGARPDDGEDDAEAIRAALTAAAPGDEVLVPAGTYDLVTTDPDDDRVHVTLADGVHLRGEGRERTVLRAHGEGDDSTVLRGAAVSDVVVADLTVTSTHEGPLGTDTEDGDAGGGPHFGVYVGERDGRGSRRVLLEGLRVERFERHGISVKASREVIVRANEVADATAVGPGGQGYGIAVEGRAGQRDTEADNDSRHHVVVGNTLDGTHLRHAVLLQFATHNNLVADNVVEGSLLDAIDLHGEGEYLNEIRGNIVTGCRRAAIALGNSGGSTHEHGASGEGNWVHHNELVDNGEGVVVVLGTPDTLVEDNWVVAGERSEAAFRVDDGPGTVLRGNRVDATEVEGFRELVGDDDVTLE